MNQAIQSPSGFGINGDAFAPGAAPYFYTPARGAHVWGFYTVGTWRQHSTVTFFQNASFDPLGTTVPYLTLCQRIA